jgi:hypothetical protein
VPFVSESFRLDVDPESARNLHKILKRLVLGALERLGAQLTVGFGSCTVSPNVMILTWKCLSGERAVDDGAEPELSIVIGYGCIFHALANAVKDAQKLKHLQDALEKVTTLSHFFSKNDKAIESSTRSV